MRELLERFREHLARDRAPRTISTYVAVAAAFFEHAAGRADRAAVEAFLGRPRGDGSPRSRATRNQELAALRALASFLVAEQAWAADPTAGLAFVREPPRDPHVLSTGEVRALFSTAATSSPPDLRTRNLAILAILSQVGLRVHELVGLDVAQVDLASATLVAVLGKGGTRHDLPLNAPALSLLTAWISERERLANPNEPALFVSRTGRRLSVRSEQYLVERLREACGTKKRITPHTFRHSAATLALGFGVDLATVADLLRHSDVNVTRRYYLHLVDERRRGAVERLATTVPAEVLPTVSGISPANDVEPAATRIPVESQGDSSPSDPSCFQRHLGDAPHVSQAA